MSTQDDKDETTLKRSPDIIHHYEEEPPDPGVPEDALKPEKPSRPGTWERSPAIRPPADQPVIEGTFAKVITF